MGFPYKRLMLLIERKMNLPFTNTLQIRVDEFGVVLQEATRIAVFKILVFLCIFDGFLNNMSCRPVCNEFKGITFSVS